MGCIPSKKEVVPKNQQRPKKAKQKSAGWLERPLPEEGRLAEDAEMEAMCEDGEFELHSKRESEIKRAIAQYGVSNQTRSVICKLLNTVPCRLYFLKRSR